MYLSNLADSLAAKKNVRNHYFSDLNSSYEFNNKENQRTPDLACIYTKYDFKFSCDFKQHKELKSLAYAKPLIQFFIDQLINELNNNKSTNPLTTSKLESLINAFTPMYLNRLARVSDDILLSDPRIQMMREQFYPLPGTHRFEPFVMQIQNYEFVEYLNCQYPDLFPQLIQISKNWIDFVLAFSTKLTP